jgi:ribosomal protein L24
VIAGKRQGPAGTVLRVLGEKVSSSNVNMVKRHTKPNPQANQPGGIVEREAPIHVSNVMLFNPVTEEGRPRRHQARSRTDARSRVFAPTAKSWTPEEEPL